MGCSQSKKAKSDVAPPKPAGGGPAPSSTPQAGGSPSSKQSSRSSPSKTSSRRGSSGKKNKSDSRPEALYHHLLGGLSPAPSGGPPPGTTFRAATAGFWAEANRLASSRPSLASYVDPTTSGTPLHVACSLGSSHAASAELSGAATACVATILAACPGHASARDRHGHVPLEGVLAAILRERDGTAGAGGSYRFRTDAARMLLERDPGAFALDGDAVYGIATALPDDFAEPTGPTVEFVRLLVSLGGVSARTLARGGGDGDVDGDDTLALLYRRFVRQFDQSERFFAGDNSRPEVTEHRSRFKNAAVNTFHVIEALLTPAGGDAADDDEDDGGRFLVRNAVRADSCPPDLLRYIVETNLGGVADADSRGNLPLHYAAGYDRVAAGVPRLPGGPGASGLPESYSKYVIDELLYAYPDGASVENGDGTLPVVLAIESGKKWFGGGIRSLHEAYPDGMARANLEEGHPLASAVSFESQQAADDDDDDTLVAALDGPSDGGEEGTVATGVDGAGGRTRKRRQRRRIRKDESHDAIMFVQRPTSTARDVASVMWANEEDAGVAMLGCAALADRAAGAAGDGDGGVGGVVSVALHGVTAAVNAMKNHPNEPAVQERACQALTAMGPADGRLEVSFAASGAVSTVVSAMQAHVSDATVQREACRALRAVASSPGGGDGDRATVVASVSGLTALANTMTSHPDDAGVQSEAVRALEALVARGGGSGGDGGGPGLPGLPEQTEALLAAALGRFPEECAGPVEAIRASIAG